MSAFILASSFELYASRLGEMGAAVLSAVGSPLGITVAFARAGSVRLADDGQNFADFHNSFEIAQVVANLLLGFFAKDFGNPAADLTGGRLVLEHNSHIGAAVAGCSGELDRAAVLD